ncbi:MAG: lysylphosphatidylglycerol synthase transmembrane domain-containing protein [Alphaproteobacteria bacterium]
MTGRIAGFAIRLAVSAGLVWFAVRDVDGTLLAARATTLAPGWVAVAFAFGMMVNALGVWRWSIVTRRVGAPLSAWLAGRLFFIGLFFNQTLPSSIGGDAFRVALAWRAGAPRAASAAGVVLDRLIGLAGLALLAAPCLALLAGRFTDATAWWGAVALVGAVYAALVAFGLLVGPLSRLVVLWRRTRPLAQFGDGIGTLLSDPRTGAKAIALALAGHMLTAVVAVALARAMDLPLDSLATATVVPLLLIVSLAPFTLAGWGVREGAAVVAYGALGLGAADAAALSVAFGVTWAVLGLPGGVLWLLGRRRGAIIPAGSSDRTRAPSAC